MSVTTLIQKLIKHKQSFIIIYNDSTKAFDNMDTNRLAKVLRQKLQSKPEIAEQIILRLNNVAYVTEQNGQSITQHTQQGAPQGCPLSPQTFNIGMQEIGNETNIKRREKLGLMDLKSP
jgi:retron-type reverse transcriptase